MTGSNERNGRPNPLERGGVLPFVALSLGVLTIAAALAIDIGRMTDNNRKLQSVADLAALDAVRSLNDLPAAAQQSTVEIAALESAERNQHGAVADDLTVELGFAAQNGAFTPATAAEIPNAVRVTAIRPIDYLFVDGGRSQSRPAVAANASLAGLSIGSFAAAIDGQTVPLLNHLLGSQLGGPVSLTLVGYQGLAAADVTLGELTAAGSFATVQQLLDAELTADEFFAVLITALTSRGDTNALAALGPVDALRLTTITTQTMRLGDLLAVEVGTGPVLAAMDLTVGDLVQGAAAAVDDQNLTTITVGAAVPGIVDGTIKATGIEAPQIVIGGPGSTVSTSQVRLYLDLELADILGAPLHLPMAIDIAPATATITNISCNPDGSGAEVTSQVDTSLGLIRIGELTEAEVVDGSPPSPATLLDVPLVVSVQGDSHTAIDQSTQLVVHGEVFDENNTIRAGGAASYGTFVAADANLNVTVLDSVIVGGVDLSAVIRPQIEQVLNGLEPTINHLASTHRVTVGGADVTAFSANCHTARLVG